MRQGVVTRLFHLSTEAVRRRHTTKPVRKSSPQILNALLSPLPPAMTALLIPQTLFPLPFFPHPRNPSARSRTGPRRKPLTLTGSKEVERGVEFETGDSFFRRESAVGRDLGVLAAALHRMSLGRGLRVLDAMCGCGIRSLRYLSQAGAAFVWANDAFEGYRGLILSNLSGEARVSPEGDRRWVVTHLVANKSRSEACCTSRRLMGTHRAGIGLISGAYREAVALGFHLSPLFSYYSYHGPVFRVMLQVARGKPHKNSWYSFISYCNRCGNSQTFPWEELGQISCPCRNGGVSSSVVVSGPLWTGPLHDAAYLTEMLKLAREWGWASTKQNDVDLEKLLNQMIDESDPQLPPGYIKLDEIARRAKINSPPISTLISTLEKEGFVACRSHIAPNAVKTNCPMAACIHIARELGHVR
uniref:Uncharacterized protein LOC105057196 isoform X2 n=1 Tax=Elaeis guineensis var. tenera TaxID=51953 RepID=A0A8N4IH42_ELAGV|nr:uncharacterized protein LOC105057196 isoform X2 [Elaeis guineensis]